MPDPRTVVGFIPARAGSKRVEGKNVRRLGDHPLLAYSIAAARESDVFSAVIVSTDSERYAEIARHYGAEVLMRPAQLAGDLSPDIEWVQYTLSTLAAQGRTFDCFSILRPTSPFRRAETIRRAWSEFQGHDRIDSIRAVEKCTQHPGKMWVVRDQRLLPLLPFDIDGRPWHSSQYQALPPVYVQNASLEIAWSRVALEAGSIAGSAIAPFFTAGFEGYDINQPDDFALAELLVARGDAELPAVGEAPFHSHTSVS